MKKKYVSILTLDGYPAVMRRGNPPQIIAQFQRGEDGERMADEYAASMSNDITPHIATEIQKQERFAAAVHDAALGILAATGHVTKKGAAR